MQLDNTGVKRGFMLALGSTNHKPMQPSHGALRPGGLFSESFGPNMPSQCRACWHNSSSSLWRNIASDNLMLILDCPDYDIPTYRCHIGPFSRHMSSNDQMSPMLNLRLAARFVMRSGEMPLVGVDPRASGGRKKKIRGWKSGQHYIIHLLTPFFFVDYRASFSSRSCLSFVF